MTAKKKRTYLFLDQKKISDMFERGMQLHRENKLDKAKKIYEHILKLSSKQPHVIHMLGVVAYHENQLTRSLQLLNQAIEIEPEQASFYSNLGNTLKKMGKLEKAEAAYIQALEIDPSFFQAYYNLGNLYLQTGELIKAELHYKRAIQIQPNFAEANCQLGHLKELEFQWDNAEAYYLQSIEADASFELAHYCLGQFYYHRGDFDKAEVYFQNALSLEEKADTHHRLSIVYEQTNDLKSAVEQAKLAYQFEPNQAQYLAHLYHLYAMTCQWKQQQSLLPRLIRASHKALHLHEKAETPFMSLLYFQDASHHQKVARQWSREADLIAHHQAIQFNFHPHRDKEVLKIGYLSNDFYNHATVHLIKSMLQFHDRSRFEVYVFSYTSEKDEYTQMIQESCDVFVDIQDTNDSQAAELIHRHQIDILIDLKGHTGGARLGIAARRPAPIQIAYLGFAGTSGAKFYDYAIADSIVVSEAHRVYFDEKIIFMPHTYQVADSTQAVIETPSSRTKFGLPDDKVILANFNQCCRYSEKNYELWLDILEEYEHSALWLLDWHSISTQNLRKMAAKRKIDKTQLIFAKPKPRHAHLKRLACADLVLDTLNYNGHTSTSDALWAGVPVVSMLGSHFASRVSASLLTAHGLPELIAYDLQGYRDIIAKYLEAPDLLYPLREKTQDLRLNGHVFNTPAFTQQIEQAYNLVWKQFAEELPKGHIDLKMHGKGKPALDSDNYTSLTN